MVQIDIPMPTNCATCRIQHNIGCNIAKDNGMNAKERDVRCPLKELIQCKDCAYAIYKEGIQPGNIVCTKPYTERWQTVKPNDWFCADGERR